MGIEIISRRRAFSHWHLHRCPICRKIKREQNEVCQLHHDHVFACVTCLQDHRLRFGTDLLLDIYMDAYQLQRFQQMAPDQKANELDLRDQERASSQLAEAAKLAKDQPPVKPKTAEETLEEQFSSLEERIEKGEVEVITQDEVMAEIEKIRKQEKETS